MTPNTHPEYGFDHADIRISHSLRIPCSVFRIYPESVLFAYRCAPFTTRTGALPVILLIVFSLLTSGAATAAPPKLDGLFPAGAQRGSEILVTGSGSFSSWPVKVWVDRPGVEVTADEKQGQLKVRVDSQAACGVYWLRCYTAEGSSALRPFVVDSLPEVIEREPNDTLDQRQELSSAAIINGRLEKRGDVDGFAIHLEADQLLVASLEAHRSLGSPMDGVLQICTSQGFVLRQNDDARGLDPLLSFTAPKTGQYIVRTFAFPAAPDSTIAFAGAKSYRYRLTLATGGFLDHALPLAAQRGRASRLKLFGGGVDPAVHEVQVAPEPEDAWLQVCHPRLASHVEIPVLSMPCLVEAASSGPEQPQPIELPCSVSGRIESAGDEDVFEFAGRQGQKVLVRAESDQLGFLLDPLLVLRDEAGQEIARVDDTGGRDAVLQATLSAAGLFRLSVRDVHGHGGLRYVYRLTLREQQPDFALTLAADSHVLVAGKTVEIPVTVRRLEGFGGELQIGASSLPQGVSAALVQSAAKGDSSKSVKLVLSATAAAGASSGPIQIYGLEVGGLENRRLASYSLGATSRGGNDVWLTVMQSK